MGKILLVRHGETDWNKARKIMGREAIGLNEAGRAHSRLLRDGLKDAPIEAIYSSPVLRALETAQIIGEDRGLSLISDERLVEVHYGEWVGKTFLEVRAMPGYVPYMHRLETPVAPGGETLYQVRDRAMSFIHEAAKYHPEGNIVVVSHADWIKCVYMEILSIPFEKIWSIRIDNATICILETEERGFRVLGFNHGPDLAHVFVPRISF